MIKYQTILDILASQSNKFLNFFPNESKVVFNTAKILIR